MTAGSGLYEVGATIFEDITSGNIHAGHGLVTIGLWYLHKLLSDIVEGSDYFMEAIKSKDWLGC